MHMGYESQKAGFLSPFVVNAKSNACKAKALFQVFERWDQGKRMQSL